TARPPRTVSRNRRRARSTSTPRQTGPEAPQRAPSLPTGGAHGDVDPAPAEMAQPSGIRCGPRLDRAHTVESEPGRTPEDEGVPGRQTQILVGAIAALGVAESEEARIDEAPCDAGGRIEFVLVLVHAHLRLRIVMVHKSHIRMVAGRIEPPGCGGAGWQVVGAVDDLRRGLQDLATQAGHPVGEGEDRGAVDVDGSTVVATRSPMPAQADR